MRRTFVLGVLLLLTACSQRPTATTAARSASAAPGVAFATASTQTAAAQAATPSPPTDAQDMIAGPAGMTLTQEVGAVMMVGFKGPLTDAVLTDWRRRQFGGLFVVSANQNANGPAAITTTIQRIREAAAHALLAATDHEGGSVCFRESGAPCLAGRTQAEMATMAQALKALGFDMNLAPDSGVGAVAGIHAAGMYAATRAGADIMMVRTTDVHQVRTVHGYSGLIISDDLHATAADAEIPAAAVTFLRNGGDMVLVSHDLAVADATYDAIHAAVVSGAYPRAQLDASVAKLLSLRLRYMP